MTRRSNCLLWAVLLYLRRRAKGKPGYLMLRRSTVMRMRTSGSSAG